MVHKICTVAEELGHEVEATENDIAAVASKTTEVMPDLALVGLTEADSRSEEGSARALELISELVHEAACPVVALTESQHPEFVERAAERGISAYASPIGQPEIR